MSVALDRFVCIDRSHDGNLLNVKLAHIAIQLKVLRTFTNAALQRRVGKKAFRPPQIRGARYEQIMDDCDQKHGQRTSRFQSQTFLWNMCKSDSMERRSGHRERARDSSDSAWHDA